MSAPANNSAMSGNFDFPPASGPSTAASRSTRHLLHQRLREFNSIRAQQEPGDPGDVQREARRAAFQDRTPAPPPSIARHARPFNRRARPGTLIDPRANSLMDRIRTATSEADTLLDQPIPRIGSPDISAREYTGEAEVNRQRKRRKIDHEDRPLGVGMNGFRYGYRGSVAPGPLKMEIVCYDGGLLHTEGGRTGREYLPENVLRNDRSVYCTITNKCNIILRHKEETTFTLSKLIIKAPATGFTAPIQEGLIFITMTSDNLLSSTEAYKIRTPSSPPGTNPSRDEENQRPPSRRRDSTSRLVPPPISHLNALPSTSAEYNAATGIITSGQGHQLFSSPSAINPITNTRTTTPPAQVPGFDITTHCDSPTSDEEEPSSAATLADRQRRDQAPPQYMDHSSDDSEDFEDGIERVLEARALGISPRMLRGDTRTGGNGANGVGAGRVRRRAEPSRIECRVPIVDVKAGHQQQQSQQQQSSGPLDGDSNGDGQSYDHQQDSEYHPNGRQHGQSQSQQDFKPPYILPPHARFFIEPKRSVVSVKFDPAVTGKFILLKLWSPSRDQNIDVQSIIAHGFAGPRYFPGEVLL